MKRQPLDPNGGIRRKRVDLGRLPAPAQYAIALGVIGGVAALAWVLGKDRPIPAWVGDYLIPAGSWIVVLLFFSIILRRWFRR